MRTLRVVALCCVLTGCAPAYQLTLMSRTGGVTGTGTATGTTRDGKITINLAGKTYTGTWTAAVGGSFGFMSGNVGVKPVSATMIGIGGAAGNALLRSPDGSGLRCQFQYGSGAGYGACYDDAGTVYDLQIH